MLVVKSYKRRKSSGYGFIRVAKHIRSCGRKRRRGGALSDWIPSLSTVASYVPGYNSVVPNVEQAKNLYNLGKEAYQASKDVDEPYIAPSRAVVPYEKAQAEKKRGKLYPFFQQLKKYSPIKRIDDFLKVTGLRDDIRTRLGKSDLGKAILTGADYAISKGFGRRKSRKNRNKRRKYGGYYIVNQRALVGPSILARY